MPSSAPPSPLVQLFTRLSTSIKMLVLMSVALAPLGLIASLASIETAHANRANREVAARLRAGDSADRLNLFLSRSADALRTLPGSGADACARADTTLAALAGGPLDGLRSAAFDATGRALCSDPGLAAAPPAPTVRRVTQVLLDPKDASLLLIVPGSMGSGWAIAEVPAATLARIGHPDAIDGSFALSLVDRAGAAIQLAGMDSMSIGRNISTDLPVAGGQLHLRMEIVAAPLSANELLLTLLPILMWIAGAAIGWLVIDRLLVRPLGDMQAAVDRYRIYGGKLVVPDLTTPALELRALGEAFSGASETIAQHEADLEEGLARQTKLTREVHHRVKNNLQVVASLLNIHARGAATPSAADAYATIQRRVDALALVHRSHYAELEVNRGVALRPLIGELASNLRGSAPAGTPAPQIVLALAGCRSSQDTAVSVAFFVTEVVEAAMLRVPGARIAISLSALEAEPGRAVLAIASNGLTGDAASSNESSERFERVVGGLARQLRAPLERDAETGRIAVQIMILPDSEAGSDEE